MSWPAAANLRAGHVAIASPWQPGVAAALPQSSLRHPLRDARRGLHPAQPREENGALDWWDPDAQVDAVADRPRDALLVAAHNVRQAVTWLLPLAEVATRARVGRHDKQKARREPDGSLAARHEHFTLLEWLTQCVDHSDAELRRLVHEQDTPMCLADSARARDPRAATNHRGHRCGVVRIGERRLS